MKQTIEILDQQEVQRQGNKPYTKYKTTIGSINVFEDATNKELDKFGYNTPIDVEVEQKGRWQNIKKVYGEPAPTEKTCSNCKYYPTVNLICGADQKLKPEFAKEMYCDSWQPREEKKQ
jgi:hypothetical protein